LEKTKRIPAGVRFSLEIKKKKVLRLEHLMTCSCFLLVQENKPEKTELISSRTLMAKENKSQSEQFRTEGRTCERASLFSGALQYYL
jgi:hypothetical protein